MHLPMFWAAHGSKTEQAIVNSYQSLSCWREAGQVRSCVHLKGGEPFSKLYPIDVTYLPLSADDVGIILSLGSCAK